MNKLFAAMAKAFPEIEGATKDRNNPHFKSKYADLSSVVEAIKPALVRNDLFYAQKTHDRADGVCVETIVGHSSGEVFSFGELFVPAAKRDPQGFGSALTYARRYSLMTAFGVCPEDDDGNAATKAVQGASGGAGHSQVDAVNPPAADKLTDAVSQPHKTQLKGPYKTKTALWKAVREFDRELRGCGDSDELDAFVNMKESQELLKQCDEEVPALSITGEGMPDEFVPLRTQIARMKSEFDAVASGLVAPNGQTIINA